MSHPYSNAAGYIYANEYEAPSDRHGTLTVDHQPSAGRSHYAHYGPLPAERVEIDPRRFGNIDRMRPGQKSYLARAMGPGMKSISTTTTTQTSSNISRVSPLPSRTTSDHSHGNPGPAVKYTPSKRVHTPYDPFAYHPSVYDTQDFIHTDDPPKAKSKFRFKFKLTLPSVFRFRSYPRSPTSSWPPDSSLLNKLAAQLPSMKTTTTTVTKNPCFPLHGGRGVPLYDADDDDPSSSHWRWSSFEQHKSSSFKLRRWLSKTKSKTFTKSVAPPRPSTYHAPLQNTHQEWDKSHTKTSSGDLHRDTMKGRTSKRSLRFAQDVVQK